MGPDLPKGLVYIIVGDGIGTLVSKNDEKPIELNEAIDFGLELNKINTMEELLGVMSGAN